MEGETSERTAASESIFREINEGIKRGQWPGDEGQPVGFRCECARLGCSELVAMTVRDYERVRRHPRRFLVARGHERPEIETVIETHPDYAVVEKRGQAGLVAEDSDPRR